MAHFEELHDKVKEGNLDAAAKKAGAPNWRRSIEDLLKAVGKDSSVEARTELAHGSGSSTTPGPRRRTMSCITLSSGRSRKAAQA